MGMSAISTSLLLSHAVAGLFISYLCGYKLIYASEPFLAAGRDHFFGLRAKVFGVSGTRWHSAL